MTESEQEGNWKGAIVRRYIARALLFICMACPVLLLILVCLINPLVGERNATVAFFLYLPQFIWIFSLMPFAVVSWFICRRWLWVYLLTLIVATLWGMGWRIQWVDSKIFDSVWGQNLQKFG